MSAQLTDEEALNRVASYCSAAEHCRAEVNEKLQRWGIAYETIARILERLETEKYIDDERFCRAFVNDKFRFAKWGKMKIAQGLYMKKIPSDVAWRHLNEIDDEEYLSILRDLLASKRKSIHAKDDYELNGKLMRFAMSRGLAQRYTSLYRTSGGRGTIQLKNKRILLFILIQFLYFCGK